MAGFFDSIKKAMTVNDTEKKESGFVGKAKKALSNVLKPEEKFEWGMKQVKNYSEKKIKFSTEISDIDHDFSFYDENVQLKKTHDMNIVLDGISDEIKENMKETMRTVGKKKVLTTDVENAKVEMNRVRKLPASSENKAGKVTACEGKYRSLNGELSQATKLIDALQIKYKSLVEKRTELAHMYVMELSYIDGKLPYILDYIEKMNLKSDYIAYGIQALKKRQEDEHSDISREVSNLFKLEPNFNNPELAAEYGNIKLNSRDYKEALRAFSYLVNLYPDNGNLHGTLSYLHEKLGQKYEQELETTIYEMLC